MYEGHPLHRKMHDTLKDEKQIHTEGTQMSTDNNMDSAIREIEALAAENDFRTKSWKDILERSDMRSIVIQPKFLRALGDCFVLKQIDDSMRDFMNEQLDRITGLLRERGIDLTDSQEIEAVEYARSKVKSAYYYRQAANQESARKYYWIVAIVAFVFTFVSRCAIQMDQQRQEQEQKERQEQYREYEEQIKEERQTQIEDMLEEDPQMAVAMKMELQMMLELGQITQEEYDSYMMRFGLDEIEEEER